jgi:hypothetical protein
MHKDETAVRHRKRARFAQASRRRIAPWPAVLIGLLFLGVVGILFAAGVRAPASNTQGEGTSTENGLVAATYGHEPYPEVVAQGGVVRLPLSEFEDGRARFYAFVGGGRPIEFFVLKSTDGVVRAALNACDVCFEARRGYHQEGPVMVCNNCGRRFPSTRINVVQGGCNPAPLRSTIDGSSLVIDVQDLVAGQRYF